jgi:hypothetical protein
MSKGIYDNRLMLPLTYSLDVINLQNGTSFGQIIDASIDNSLQVLLILQITMSLFIAIMIVPIYCSLK